MPTKRGFTLVEVLVTLIVIALVSVSLWVGAAVLMKTSLTGSNRSQAVNLLQKSQEEVRRAALTFFDTLETCRFPSPDGTGLCGFADTALTFPGFLRHLQVTPEKGSTELKRALITVSWSEWGRARQLQSMVLVSRPPAPLPGNVVGKVTSGSAEGAVLSGVTLTVTQTSGTVSRSTLSGTVVDERGANFNFADTATGRFLLPAGSWILTASRSGYFSYTHPEPLIVGSNEEIFVALSLEPKPTSATITARLQDSVSGAFLSSFSSGLIRLYRDGGLYAESGNQPAATFTIPFSDTQTQCFTLNTYRAYRAAYAGAPPSCNPAVPYHADGWSSARMQADGTLACGYPWQGGAASGAGDPDRICVDPGDRQTVNVPLVPIPRAVISGRVVASSTGDAISGASVYVDWPSSTGSPRWTSSVTRSDGTFSVSVPAAQDLFADGNTAYYMQVWAQATGPIMDCCHVERQETRSSARVYVGPLRQGDSRDAGDLVVPTDERALSCGNAQGHLRDDRGLFSLAGVSLTLSSSTTTDAQGDYLLACPAESAGYYRLRTGSYAFTARKSGYYDYSSRGNRWYARVADAVISANAVTTYDSRMWPKGYGQISGTVRDKGTGNPLAGAVVTLTLYDGSQQSAVTDAAGVYTFATVLETWPPAALSVSDPFYNHSAGAHALTVTHPSGIYLSSSAGIPHLDNGQALVVDVDLTTQGNM